MPSKPDGGLSREENECFPPFPPPLVYHGSTVGEIVEPRGELKPKHPTTKFIVAYMQQYVGELFAKSQLERYVGDINGNNINAACRNAIYLTYRDKMGDFKAVSHRDWVLMTAELEAEYREFRSFNGSWGAKWLLTRTWTSRNRNKSRREKGTMA